MVISPAAAHRRRRYWKTARSRARRWCGKRLWMPQFPPRECGSNDVQENQRRRKRRPRLAKTQHPTSIQTDQNRSSGPLLRLCPPCVRVRTAGESRLSARIIWIISSHVFEMTPLISSKRSRSQPSWAEMSWAEAICMQDGIPNKRTSKGCRLFKILSQVAMDISQIRDDDNDSNQF